jgi:hypothetical protein
MTDNVIILTGGLTGSSVLAGLLAAAGYWTGPQTFLKPDYDTHENAGLIGLNRELMKQVGVGEEYTKYFLPAAIMDIARLEAPGDDRFAGFIEECNAHSPWLWKDPRLWLTIRYWDRLLPEQGVRFLLLDRELLQAWISLAQRRLIQTWGNTKTYHTEVQASLRNYLAESRRPYLSLTYEELIVTPEAVLARLTDFLGVPISMGHLTSTYKGTLYKKNKGVLDALEAILIYAKNYRQRLR